MGYFRLTGYLLLGLGAPLALLCAIWRKPLLLLSSLSSSFVWLLILMANSILWLIFHACGIPNALSIFAAIGVEEGFRPLYLRGVKLTVSKINHIARINSMPLVTPPEQIAIALACGFGHGLSHCIAFFVILLTPTLAKGTRFNDNCPQLSIFLFGACSTLSIFLLLTSAMVISFNLSNERKGYGKLLVPALRIFSSLVGVFSVLPRACVATLPVQLIIGIGATLFAWYSSAREVVRLNGTFVNSSR